MSTQKTYSPPRKRDIELYIRKYLMVLSSTSSLFGLKPEHAKTFLSELNTLTDNFPYTSFKGGKDEMNKNLSSLINLAVQKNQNAASLEELYSLVYNSLSSDHEWCQLELFLGIGEHMDTESVDDVHESQGSSPRGPKSKRTFSEVANAQAESIRKKAKFTDAPLINWADLIVESSEKKPTTEFYSAVENVRKGILGITISNTIVLPKNFDACFGILARMLRVMAKKLDIAIGESPVTLDTNAIWVETFNKATTESISLLAQQDESGKMSAAVLNLFEAFDFIMRPSYTVESRPGIDFVRFLICQSDQDEYNNRLPQVEPAFKYTSKTKQVFEACISALSPRIGDLGQYFSTYLTRLVVSIFSSNKEEKLHEALQLLAKSLYLEDRSIISRSYNTTKRRKLTEAGKKRQAAKQKLTEKDYVEYTAVVKPSVEAVKIIASTEELMHIKNLNTQLQTLESNVKLPDEQDQKRRKNYAKAVILLVHTKCANIEQQLSARKQAVHKLLKSARNATLIEQKASKEQIEADAKIAFTPEEWNAAKLKFLETAEPINKTIEREFIVKKNAISFQEIANKAFQS